MVKVSAILSVYNGGDLLAHRLTNLIKQDLFRDGALEVVCVNAGNSIQDANTLTEYSRTYDNIRVYDTLRDPLYHSWNIGIQHARGEYITNANADDRLAPFATRKLAEALDNGADVAYGSCYCTVTRNAEWSGEWDFFLDDPINYHDGKVPFGHEPFDPDRLARQCFIGPFPMWRKALHDRVGYFDSAFAIAGDYEMWLRFAAHGATFQNIPLYLGLFYFADTQLSQSSHEQLMMENRLCRLRWQSKIIAEV